jgi:hypothetical protein
LFQGLPQVHVDVLDKAGLAQALGLGAFRQGLSLVRQGPLLLVRDLLHAEVTGGLLKRSHLFVRLRADSLHFRA